MWVLLDIRDSEKFEPYKEKFALQKFERRKISDGCDGQFLLVYHFHLIFKIGIKIKAETQYMQT